jgi:hypothetical protein
VGLPPERLVGLAAVEGMGLALVEQVQQDKATTAAPVQTETLVVAAAEPVLLGVLTEVRGTSQVMAALGLFLLLLALQFNTLEAVAAERIPAILLLAVVQVLEMAGRLQLMPHLLLQIRDAVVAVLNREQVTVAPASSSFVTQQTLTPRHQ